MPVVDLTFVIDNREEFVFVQHVQSRPGNQPIGIVSYQCHHANQPHEYPAYINSEFLIEHDKEEGQNGAKNTPIKRSSKRHMVSLPISVSCFLAIVSVFFFHFLHDGVGIRCHV